MRWIAKAAVFVTSRAWPCWEKLTADPARTQSDALFAILRRNRFTVFGKDHRFDAVSSLRDYRRHVPVRDYEGLRAYVERVEAGEANVLTEEPVSMFALTSGSTGAPKLIPVTQSSRANHRRLTRLWYYRAYLDHPTLFDGKLLGAVSPAHEGMTPGQIPFGAASGLVYQSSPRWIQNAFAVPYEAAQVKEFAAKYYLIMRLAIEHPISFFGTPNPSTILRLVETADQYKDDLIRDIRDGTISSRCALAPALRSSLEARLKKNSRRAAQLESFAGRAGALRPREYWPGLALIGCWKGGSVGVRLHELPRWFGAHVPVRDLGYMASEAQITLPITDAGCGGILDIAGNFYEFIPESEIGSGQPEALTCDQLESGQSYYPILTTPAGLYRYDINDVVRVAGFHKRTPILEFVRKGRDVTSITGEKLHVNQVIAAMAEAQKIAGLVLRHYGASADVDRSRYLFSVEFDAGAPEREALERLLKILDDQLCRLNVEYREKRRSDRLHAPVLQIMRSGWFERKTSAALRRTGRDAQIKMPLLSNEPEDAAEISSVIECVGPSGEG